MLEDYRMSLFHGGCKTNLYNMAYNLANLDLWWIYLYSNGI